MAYDFTDTSLQSLTANASVTGYPLTIVAWFNGKSTIGLNQFLATVDTSSAVGFHGIVANRSGTTVQAVSNAGGGPSSAISTTTWNINQWNHAAGIFADSTSRTVYLNAAGASTNTVNVAVTGINNTSISGRWATSFGLQADALIADVGIWNAALTQPEIASLAKGMACDKVRPQSLVFYAPLARDLIDVRGGRTITNNNGATVVNHPRIYT
jgi:hypothetical protein